MMFKEVFERIVLGMLLELCSIMAEALSGHWQMVHGHANSMEAAPVPPKHPFGTLRP